MNVLEIIEEIEKETESLDFEALQSFQSKTDLWLEKRRGRFTASEFHRLMGYEDKEELPKGAETYVTEKAVEVLTDSSDSYTNEAMNRGKELEVESVLQFMERTGLEVEKYGNDQEFEPLGKHVGCTPDGRIGEEGGIEGKCPNSKTHFFYLNNLKNADDLKKHCKDYYWQIQGGIYVTGAKWWYFFSYDPRFRDKKHKIHIVKIERNEEDIEKLKNRLTQAIALKNKILSELDA